METYRILGGLHRHGLQGDQEIELILGARDREEEEDKEQKDEDEENRDPNSEKKKKKRVLKFTDGQGEKTLDKEANINIVQFDTELMIDPLFRQTTQKFDEVSMGSLMSSRLNINSDLLIQLDSSMPQQIYKDNEQLMQICEEVNKEEDFY